MVKFVGGPSVGGYKSYINHTTAREGQWRMPRNYKPANFKVDIRNYNTCCHQQSVNTGFQPPAWLQCLLGGFNLFSSFIPQPKEAAQPETNPLQKQLEEMQKQIDDLKKENEDLKNKKPENTNGDPKVDNTPEDDNNPEVDPKFDVSADAEEITKTTKEEITTTTEAVVKKGRKRADGKVEYQGWKTLTASYGVPNTKEFRNWFRQEHLNGKDIWEIGTQNFPTEIEYPKGSGKIYKFNGDTFAKPIDLHDNSGTGSVTVANMDKKTEKQTTTTTTFKGTATATWTDNDGQQHTIPHTTDRTDFNDKEEARKTALAEIRNKVPKEFRSNAKFTANAN